MDSSIYSMIRPTQGMQDPLESYAKVMTIKHLMDQGDLGALQRRQLTSHLEEEEGVKNVFRNMPEGGDINSRIGDVMRVSPKTGLQLQKQALETENTRAQIATRKMEALSKATSLMKERLAGVRDEAGYQQFLESGKQMFGPDLMTKLQLPPNFDPEWQKRELVKAEHLFTPKFEKVDDGGQIRMVDTNPFTNPGIVSMNVKKTATPDALLTDERTRAEGALNRGVTTRGQNMTDARAQQTLAQGRWTNDLERGVQVNSATGETRPITTDGAPIGNKGKPLTEAQGKAGGMAMRAREANDILTQLEADGTKTRGIIKQGVEGIPLVGEGLAMGVNALPRVLGGPSSDQQRVEQARRNFVNAVLRVESGASINESEFRNAEKQYFPMPGDTPQVVAQKAQNRETAIQALGMQAGPAAEKIPPAAPIKPKPKKGSAPPQQSGGIKFLGFE